MNDINQMGMVAIPHNAKTAKKRTPKKCRKKINQTRIVVVHSDEKVQKELSFPKNSYYTEFTYLDSRP